MQKEKKIPEMAVELIDPKLFIDHPLKNELQLSLGERPQKAKDAMNNAWDQIPDQVVPVLYALWTIDGVERNATLDGSGRVAKAIENKVPLIPAIRVPIDNNDTLEIFKKILAPNHSFHISLLEIGKAAARLYKEYKVGQGKRTDLSGGKEIDPDDEIAGLLGYGLNSSRVKKARLVYEANPELLRMVDDKEMKSLSAAYNTIKRPKIKNAKSYSDGDEVAINCNTDEVATENDSLSNTQDEATTFDSDSKPVLKKELVFKNDTTAMPEVTVALSQNGNPFVIMCPCCNNQVRVKTI